MLRISLPEFGRIPRSQLGPRLLKRLKGFDEKHASSSNVCVFDWNHTHDIRAQNYVGVIQIPGLIVEILPKIDKKATDIRGPYLKGDHQALKAQHNLLYMLSLTKKIPIRE
jgi:5-methylcytosine-specific restriction endonuclease McrBC regulatory subunit McrC